jgi:hypothetical protein
VDLYGRREGKKSVAVKMGPKTGSYGWCEKVNSNNYLTFNPRWDELK